MARPKEFDPDVALTRAMELFWCRGFEATSVQDLVTHLGISRASMYATFGGKRQLYLAALQRYRTALAGSLVARLDGAEPVLPAVRGVLRSLAEEALADTERCGCLAVNAAMEVAPRDPDVSSMVSGTMLEVEQALHRALERAQASGELSTQHDPRALARFLGSTINGLRVTGKATPDRDRLDDVIAVTLSALT
jgi:TetR/AcrR family transcriptional repressor of nem operon